MGNLINLSRWLNKPTWGDFVGLMIGWAILLGSGIVAIIDSFARRPIWLTIIFVLLLLLVYVAMFYSGYCHVKRHCKCNNKGKRMNSIHTKSSEKH